MIRQRLIAEFAKSQRMAFSMPDGSIVLYDNVRSNVRRGSHGGYTVRLTQDLNADKGTALPKLDAGEKE